MPSIDYAKLAQSIQRSRLVLRWPRQQRVEIAREMLGDHFSEGGARQKVKVNLLALYHTVMTNLLVPNEPRFGCTTDDPAIRSAVRLEQDWLNEQSCRMELGETGRAVIGDALMGTGICKVALATPCEAAMLNWGITAGEPFARAVDLDDWVHDIAAKTMSECTYYGTRVRVPLDVAKKMYGKRAKQLSSENEPQYNREGDERIGRLFRGNYQPEEFEEHVELWEIYLPRHRKIVVLRDQDVLETDGKGNVVPLWEQQWIGPPWGPYLFLGFQRAPGSALYKAPMQDLLEMHLDCNNVHRKANYTLRNLKSQILFRRSASEDAEEMRKKNHLDFVPVEDPNSIKPVTMGGEVIQGLLTAGEVYKGLFDWLGGNVSMVGGLSDKNKTLGQSRMQNQHAGTGVEAMHNRSDMFMAKLGQSMLWYAHYHPQLVMQVGYRVPGSKGINRKLYPPGDTRGPARNHDFSQAKYRVDSYSLRHKTPDERLAFLMSMLQGLTPLMPLWQQQGVALDAKEVVQTIAEYGDAPELNDWFTTVQQPSEQGGATEPPHTQTLPANTTRTYNRQDSGGGGEQGPGQQLAEMSPSDFQGQGAQ